MIANSQEGPVPAFTALYESRPYFMNVTAFKDYGVSLVPVGRGLKFKDGKKGELVPGPHSSTYSFVASGMRYIITGDQQAKLPSAPERSPGKGLHSRF